MSRCHCESNLNRRLLLDLAEFVESALECKCGHVEFAVGPVREQQIPKTKAETMKITITDIQQFDVAVSFTDKRGNPASVVGVPQWAVSDEALLSVTPTEDGLGATVKASGPLGAGQVTLTAQGVENDETPVIGILDVEVVASEAATAVFAPSTPTDQQL